MEFKKTEKKVYESGRGFKNITTITISEGRLQSLIYIPEKEAREIVSLYRLFPFDLISPFDFITKIDQRMYTEWCLEHEKKGVSVRYREYNGEGFTEYIPKEIHYHLERRGFSWKKDAFDLEYDQYCAAQHTILSAFVRSAVDFFQKNEEGWQKLLETEEGRKILKETQTEKRAAFKKYRWEDVPPKNTRNLRISLKDFII